MPKPTNRRPQRAKPAIFQCEAEVATGLEFIAREEIRRVLKDDVHFQPPHDHPGAIRFNYGGDLRTLEQLRTVQAVHLVCHFPVPRPKALLGDQHFRALLDMIATVRSLTPQSYSTFYIGAAGSDSSVMQRVKAELSRATGLAIGDNEGDLLLRLRRPLDKREGWEVLVRVGPRPLATRAWRVRNYGGALSATVAHAMALLTNPKPEDVFLNVACGSATLLIERCGAAPARRLIGCDTSATALEAAQANIAASGYDMIELYPWDARALPLPDQSVDAICADLPFGSLQGSHSENIVLYPAILREAARVAKPGARFVLITHEARLMETVLAEQHAWTRDQTIMVGLGGLHPRIYVLRQTINT